MSCSSCLYLQVNILQKLRAWSLYNRHENTKLQSPYLTDPGTLSWPVQLVFKQPEAEADRRLQLRFVKETPQLLPASSCQAYLIDWINLMCDKAFNLYILTACSFKFLFFTLDRNQLLETTGNIPLNFVQLCICPIMHYCFSLSFKKILLLVMSNFSTEWQ